MLRLLRVDPSNPSRSVSRENSRLEYKQTCNWGSRAKYAKTMAAFANNDGGFILFGVKNSPHDLVGVNVDRFDTFDPEKAAAYLNSAFAPEIHWETLRVEVGGIQLGVFAVSPSVTRPIVCIKSDGQELREADIYFEPKTTPASLPGLLTEIVDKEFHALSSPERSHCRKAIAHLDEALNRAACAQVDAQSTAQDASELEEEAA